MVEFVIFSKDRAMQLDLLLRSLYRFVNIESRVTILLKASSIEYEIAYGKLNIPRKSNIEVTTIYHEHNFREDFLNILKDSEADYICLLVDDCVFIREVPHVSYNSKDIISFSLRLNSPEPHSGLANEDQDDVWLWQNYQGHYGYPHSLDGNVYDKTQLLEIVKPLNFHNPNWLEEYMWQSRDHSKLLMESLVKKCVINIPDNIVVDTHQNRHNGGSAENLNKMFLEGWRIDLEDILKNRFEDSQDPFIRNFNYLYRKDESTQRKRSK